MHSAVVEVKITQASVHPTLIKFDDNPFGLLGVKWITGRILSLNVTHLCRYIYYVKIPLFKSN